MDIIRCGYRRVGLNANDEVLLTPYVEVKILWMAVNPPKLHLHDRIERWAEAPHHHTAGEFSSRADLRKAAFRWVLEAVGGELNKQLNRKLGVR